MEARAKIFGHPIHQMLVALPLGLLTGAVAFDIIHLVTRGNQSAIVSFWTMAAGILTGLLAAVFGVIDFTKIPSNTRAYRIGLTHGIGNVVMVVLFAASWWLRRPDMLHPPTLAYVLCLAAGAVSVITGWLGGELVNRLSVGVDDGANLDAPSSLTTPSPGVRRVA